MTPMMSAIWCALWSMPFMVCTTWPTASPQCCATWVLPWARRLASLARSALLWMSWLSESIDAAVSCKALACCSVRSDNCWLPWAISALALATLSEAWRTWRTTSERRPCMACKRAIRLLSSPVAKAIGIAKSPAPTRSATALAWSGSPPNWVVMERMMAKPKVPASSAPSSMASTEAVWIRL